MDISAKAAKQSTKFALALAASTLCLLAAGPAVAQGGQGASGNSGVGTGNNVNAPVQGTPRLACGSQSGIAPGDGEEQAAQASQVARRRRGHVGEHPGETVRLGRLEWDLPSAAVFAYVEEVAGVVLVNKGVHG